MANKNIEIPLDYTGDRDLQPHNAVEAAVAERFGKSSYLELRQVAYQFEAGTLKLHGYVSSYYLRQIAQTLVQGLDGVEVIDNQLEVVSGRIPNYWY